MSQRIVFEVSAATGGGGSVESTDHKISTVICSSCPAEVHDIP